jgi:23S rRNA pseudouridine1911/1915/1917 synthase
MIEPPAVLWEDPHGLAVAKPAGILTQRTRAGSVEMTLEDLVRSYLRPGDPASVYLGTVHRLDRPVSGVILWAKTPRAARRWAEQFARRDVRKEYWAIVEGDASGLGESGRWVDALVPPGASGRSSVVPPETPGASLASTTYEVGRGRGLPDGLAWLKLRPETGRTHQLRAQAAARGNPIVGDSTYGASRSFPVGIALHARSLTVEHPIRHQPMTVEAPLPDSWDGWLAV